MDRADFTDVFTWAAEIQEEHEEEFPVDDIDLSWWDVLSTLPQIQLLRYMHPDTAWTDFYDIEKKRNVFIATCHRCHKTFGSTHDETARARIQIHILRHDKPPIPRYELPDECPF